MNRRHALKAFAALVVCPLCTSLASAAEGPHWSYEGSEGPDKWGTLGGPSNACGIGTQQSPIDVTASTKASLPKLNIAWGKGVDLPPLVPLGLTVHGCWHWNHQRYATRMWATVRAAGTRLDRLVTHEFPLEQVAAAMDVQESAACGKVFLLPAGAEALS